MDAGQSHHPRPKEGTIEKARERKGREKGERERREERGEREKMWVCEDVSARERKRRCEYVKMWRCEWRCEDVKMWRWAAVKMRRCEDEKMWRWEDVKMRRREDEKMWRWEDEKMWRWEDVKMRRCEVRRCEVRRCEARRCEDEKMWRWEGVKMRRCEDERMWRWEDTDPHYWKNPALWRSREKIHLFRWYTNKKRKQKTTMTSRHCETRETATQQRPKEGTCRSIIRTKKWKNTEAGITRANGKPSNTTGYLEEHRNARRNRNKKTRKKKGTQKTAETEKRRGRKGKNEVHKDEKLVRENVLRSLFHKMLCILMIGFVWVLPWIGKNVHLSDFLTLNKIEQSFPPRQRWRCLLREVRGRIAP